MLCLEVEGLGTRHTLSTRKGRRQLGRRKPDELFFQYPILNLKKAVKLQCLPMQIQVRYGQGVAYILSLTKDTGPRPSGSLLDTVEHLEEGMFLFHH